MSESAAEYAERSSSAESTSADSTPENGDAARARFRAGIAGCGEVRLGMDGYGWELGFRLWWGAVIEEWVYVLGSGEISYLHWFRAPHQPLCPPPPINTSKMGCASKPPVYPSS